MIYYDLLQIIFFSKFNQPTREIQMEIVSVRLFDFFLMFVTVLSRIISKALGHCSFSHEVFAEDTFLHQFNSHFFLD